MSRTADQRVNRGWGRRLFLIPSALYVVALGSLAIETYRTTRSYGPEWPLPSMRDAPWQTPESWVPALPALVLCLLALACLTYWWPRRRGLGGIGLATAVVVALSGAILGYAAYLPCAGGQVPLIAPTQWVLNLFVGNTDASLGPDSDVCRGPLPPGFQLARLLTLAVTFAGVLGAVSLLWRQQLWRIRVKFGSDLDIVVGLDATTLPLVRALCHHDEDRTVREDWYTVFPFQRGDLRRLLARPARVAVFVEEGNHPLLDEVQASGALAIVGDASDPDVLALALTRTGLTGKKRATVRRLFAVSASQQHNLKVLASAQKVLSSGVVVDHVREVIPTLTARFDSAREAKLWRSQNLGSSSLNLHPASRGAPRLGVKGVDWFCDGISVDGVLAELLVDAIEDLHKVNGALEGTQQAAAVHIVLVGDHPLALALLDEIAWRRWCEYDLASATLPGHDGGDRRWREFVVDVTATGAEVAPEVEPREDDSSSSYCVQRVTLVGVSAYQQAEEWRATRAPLPGPGPLEVRTASERPEVLAEAGWEQQVTQLLTPLLGDPYLIVIGDDGGYRTGAERVTSLAASATVMLPDANTTGVAMPIAAKAPVRYGPALVKPVRRRGADADDLPGERQWLPPEDSWTALARQQHEWYRRSIPVRDQDWLVSPDAEPSQVDKVKKKGLTKRPWDIDRDAGLCLPEFFREENLRQHREMLSWFEENGYRWRVRAAAEPSDWVLSLTEAELLELGGAEKQRWNDLRKARGWTRAARDDTRRHHDMLKDWSEVREIEYELNFDLNLICGILNRFMAIGLVPERAERGGETRAKEPAS